MKGIEITERQRPFSHTPGVSCLLPESTLQLQIFPASIRIFDLQHSEPQLKAVVDGDIQGPIKDFTVALDLERGCITVWGISKKGYFRYHLFALPDGHVGLHLEKEAGSLSCKESLVRFMEKVTHEKKPLSRLSLGSHKAQDWDLVRRRLNMQEIFPAWFQLGQWVPKVSSHFHGTASLLKSCEQSILAGHPEKIIPEFEKLYLAGFCSLFAPRLIDSDFQGLGCSLSSIEQSSSPLILVQEGAKLIQSLFISIEGAVLSILPHLPPEFHCGKISSLPTSFGLVDLEWTKKLVRRMTIHCRHDEEIEIQFQKSIKSFRLRVGDKDRGNSIASGSRLMLQKDKVYLFDNFLK